MFLKRSKSALDGNPQKCLPHRRGGVTTSKLFQPGVKLLVARAPVMCGLPLQKKFQRPMLKRRAYGKHADNALQQSSLGPKRRMNGMAKLMARAGRGLTYRLPQRVKTGDETEESGSDSEEDEKEPDRPFEPLCLWQSPHQGGEPKGLPSRTLKELRPDENGVEEEVTVVRPAPIEAYAKEGVFVPPVLAKWLRPHQREGVQFMYECVMGLRGFEGNGCILADDMGLGKTLQSVALIYTLVKTRITAAVEPTAKRVIVICPCSLVKNWDNEFVKWLGPGGVKTLALAEADRKTVEKNIDIFTRTKMFNILIASYECVRAHIKLFTKHKDCCDLLVCDEAHRLKNSDNQTSRALNSLPVKRRVLLTGTPMQNDLQEFYAMVDFTNPGILGTPEEFRRTTLFPILRGREPDATESQRRKMMEKQNDMSTVVNDFILRRVNTLNAEHLPPKLVQVVCCNLTEIQENMYQHLVTSKDMQHVLDGKQVNCLSSIQMLMKLCNHPSLIAEEEDKAGGRSNKRSASKTISYNEDEKESTAAPGADGIAKFLPFMPGGGRRGDFAPVYPEWSGKMFVLYRLMKEMRKPGNGNDKIVIVSNYTQTLDLIGRMCRGNSWGFCRLDGSISMKKRQKMVDEFNDPSSSLVAFLLSSKAGGCGLNLIGGNRLVLFDPDWNPAVDKQAAARCWRDGQKKRCFTYRFLATGTVEEKIFQRQLSKEGLQSVVDDKAQVNELSTKDLRNLFKLRSGTPSDTHDKLRCERCRIIRDNTEMEALKILPKKLAACLDLLDTISKSEDAKFFLQPLVPTEYERSKEDYEKLVKQPIDFGTIRSKLGQPQEHPSAYKSVSGFSKDINRVFANVLKVWNPGEDIADAARRLQFEWVSKWTELVPVLMTMKVGDDAKSSEKENDDAGVNGVDASVDPILESCALHNERGEDYQEQIGMPDEENMRHWSHHYSTNTTDDPVFRAAMRGFDSVSFVFGLEVTWSLIQQRQQEDEERLAMEALQGMEEEEEDTKKCATIEEAVDDSDDSSSLDDDDTDGKSGLATTTKKSASLDDSGADSSDSDDASITSKATAVVGEDSDDVAMEDEKSIGSPNAPSSNASTPHAEVVMEQVDGTPEAEVLSDSDGEGSEEASLQNSSDGSDGHAVKRTYQEEEHHQQQQQKEDSSTGQCSQVSVHEWQCPSCTLHNPKTLRKCDVCGTAKPREKRKRSIGSLG